jgi:type I restriction enzyme S subunit
MPFELPKGWVWCDITDIISKLVDGTHHSPKNFPMGDFMYVTAKNIKTNGICLDNITYIDSETHNEIYSRCNPEKGDILYIKDGATTGIVTINNLDQPFSLLSSVALIKPVKTVSNEFLCYFLQSSLCYNFVRQSMKGVGITRVTLQMISSWQVPLPPFAEQVRIVYEIKRWFHLIDYVEKKQMELHVLIDQTKLKTLELAIQGKLIFQNKSDEPAIELLHRINPDFTPSDISHYENLPQGWCVCKLENVIDYEQPQPYIVESTAYSDDFSTPVLTAGKSFIIGYTSETEGIVNDLPVIIFDDFTTDSKYVDFPFKVKSSAIKILHVKPGVNPHFIAMLMSITRLTSDTHKRYWISECSKITIILPPAEEQRRIVDRVNELCAQLDLISQFTGN